jgi:hypothetical protein
MAWMRKAFTVLVRKFEGKKSVVRTRRRCGVNTEINFIEVGFGCVDWIHLAANRDWWWAVLYTVASTGSEMVRNFRTR